MSKELFFNMRAEEMALMYSENFTKKDAELTGQELVKTILNDGLVDPKKVFSNVVRLKAVMDSADKSFRDQLDFMSKENFNGVEFTPTAPRESLNYDEDHVCEKNWDASSGMMEPAGFAAIARSSLDIHGLK